MLKRVLLVGEKPTRSEPILSLATELNRMGIETQFTGNALSTRKWLIFARRNQALVFIQYHGVDEFFQRLLYLARGVGCVVVRWWVGSDVLYCLESETIARKARALDHAVDLNIAVAPHLVEELQRIGITAEYVPSLCDLTVLEKNQTYDLPKGVLTYLPAERKDFYGEDVLIASIEKNPDLCFYVVNDDSHSLQDYPNVQSLGWVEEMESVWSQVGLLLRVTKHDGLPRMVLEALARRKYVIYSWPFEGCWYGKSIEQVQKHLNQFKNTKTPNIIGPEVARSVSEAGKMYVQAVSACRISPMRQLAALFSAARIYCKR